METKQCPISEIDYYSPCDYADDISYEHCYKCANGYLKELKEFIKQLKQKKENEQRIKSIGKN